MAKKSQQELELPAKVYQVDAVEVKVDRALSILENIEKQTTGVVTQTQMKEAIEEALKQSKEYADDKIGDLKLIVYKDFGPMKRHLGKIAWGFIMSFIGIVVQGFIIWLITRK